MIYIGFSTTNSLLSKIIRRFTKAEVSHTFFVFELYGRSWMLGSDWGGVVIEPMRKFVAKNTIKMLAPVPELHDEHMAMAMESLGDKYDYTGLLGGIFPMIGRLFRQKWNNPWNNSQALFCSELVAQVLRAADFPGSETLVPSETTPQDLKDLLGKR